MADDSRGIRHPTIVGAAIGAVIAGVFTVIAALILAGYLENLKSPGSTGAPDQVILVGSGTAYNFLRRNSPTIDDPAAAPRTYVLQGGTSPGVTLFSEAYYHGSQPETVPIIAMASRRLEAGDFARQGAEKYFEVVLARDDIRVSFGCRGPGEYGPVFSDLESVVVRSGVQLVGLYVDEIAEFIVKDRRCQLYVNNPGSATRYLLDNVFTKSAGSPWVWPRSQGWDLRVEVLEKESRPWMAFGTPDDIPRLDQWAAQRRASSVPILRETGEPLTRGLYLYGRLQRVEEVGREPGYRPDPRVVRVLRNLLVELSESPQALRAEIDAQMVLFGLNDGQESTLLTEANSGDGCIYGYERTVNKAMSP